MPLQEGPEGRSVNLMLITIHGALECQDLAAVEMHLGDQESARSNSVGTVPSWAAGWARTGESLWRLRAGPFKAAHKGVGSKCQDVVLRSLPSCMIIGHIYFDFGALVLTVNLQKLFGAVLTAMQEDDAPTSRMFIKKPGDVLGCQSSAWDVGPLQFLHLTQRNPDKRPLPKSCKQVRGS